MGKLIGEVQDEVGRIGGTPWLAGGDWNRTPSEMEEHWAGIGAICCAGVPTQQRGRELDWWVTTKELGTNMVVGMQEAPCPDHWPVWIKMPKMGAVDMGNCIRRPKKVDVRGEETRGRLC